MIKAIKNPAFWPWMIITAGATIRAWGIGTALFWYDESFTLLVASRSLQEALQATATDVHPPFYYVITWLLLRLFGWLPQVLVLRGFSWLCGVASLVLFKKLAGCLLAGKQAAQLAALGLIALAPVEIYYSQEARMYSLLQLLVLAAILAVYHRDWLRLATMGTLMVYTHNYGLFYWAMIGLVTLMREILTTTAHPVTNPEYAYHGTGTLPKSQFLAVFTALAAPLLAWLPWLAVLLNQMAMVGTSYWLQPVTVGGLLLAMQRGWYAVSLPLQLQVLAILGLVAGLVMVLLAGLKSRQWLLLWWALAPLAIAVAASLLWRPVLLHRGLYGSLPALAMLAGIAITGAGNAGKVGRWLLLAPLAMALLWQIQPTQPGTDHSWVYWPAPQAKTMYHIEDTTMVIYSANYPSTQHIFIQTGCPEQISALTPATRAALGFITIQLADLPSHYSLAALAGPLSSKCQADLVKQLTDQGQQVYLDSSQMGIRGVWTK